MTSPVSYAPPPAPASASSASSSQKRAEPRPAAVTQIPPCALTRNSHSWFSMCLACGSRSAPKPTSPTAAPAGRPTRRATPPFRHRLRIRSRPSILHLPLIAHPLYCLNPGQNAACGVPRHKNMEYIPIASKRDYLRRNECDGNSAVSGENRIYIKKGCRKTHGPGPFFSGAIQAGGRLGRPARMSATRDRIFLVKNHPCPLGRRARFVATVARHRRDRARRTCNESAIFLITGLETQIPIHNKKNITR